jgi:hypothetical protein
VKSILGDAVQETPGNKFESSNGKKVWAPTDRTPHWHISDGSWICGTYESELAAWFAFDFTDEQLRDLQGAKNKDNSGPITLEDLVLLRVREMLREEDAPDPREILEDAARKVVDFHGRSCSSAIERLYQALKGPEVGER